MMRPAVRLWGKDPAFARIYASSELLALAVRPLRHAPFPI
jgi:hypothetical protein